MTKKSTRSVRVLRQEAQKKRTRQRIITTLIVIGGLGALAVIVILAQQASPTSAEDVTVLESLESPSNAEGTAWGPADAPVVIEEFGDFQ